MDLDAAIHPNEITKLHETNDVKEVNEMLEDGWILYAVTRGNMRFSYLLARV